MIFSDLVQALNAVFTYCDNAYDGMTDAHAAEMVKFFGREQTKLTVLARNDEHYGDIVTYMRYRRRAKAGDSGTSRTARLLRHVT